MDSESSSSDDDEILQDMLLEQLSAKEKHTLHNYNLESLHHNEYITLHLEFKKLDKMDFLHDFTSLVRLDLNNNLIQMIWGLEHMTNLTWLNLSCNRIKNIEGLESLLKLEVLNLSNNKISLIKNMDTLENLTHFFISKNLIRERETVLYLRRFKRLFKLSIGGNPFTENDHHSFYIAAFLPSVTLLDNILISPKMREEATIQYKFELKKFKLQELQEQQAEGFEENQEALLKVHEDAVVDNTVSGSCHSKLPDDAQATRPGCLSGVAPTLQTYPLFSLLMYYFIKLQKLTKSFKFLDFALTAESQMVELCSQIFAIDSDEYKQLETELNSFFCGQIETETYYQQRALKILGEFEELHTQSEMEIKKLQDRDLLKIKISDFTDEISQLCKKLLTLEFELVRNLDDNIKKLDSSISDMLFTGNDSASNGDLPETMDDAEDQTVPQVSDLKAALIKEIQEKEEKRNRVRISDISRYIDYLMKQLEDYFRGLVIK
ncbi:dynein regulatory complex subunit 3 isoform 1-T1 [Anableps anableps]